MVVELAQTTASNSAQGVSAARFKRVLQSVDEHSCPSAINLHMHTVCSDGQLEPEALIAQAVDIGLQHLAITDHHSVDGYWRATNWLKQQYGSTESGSESDLPTLWAGVEINTGLLDIEVHILCYSFDPSHKAMQPYFQGCSVSGDRYQAAQVIAAAHQAGGLAVLAHPDRYRRSPADLIAEAARLGIDGVETYYAYDNPCPWRPSPRQTEMVRRLSSQFDLLNTCGTDTHGKSLLQRL